MPPVIVTLPHGPDTAGLPAVDGGRLQAAWNQISGQASPGGTRP